MEYIRGPDYEKPSGNVVYAINLDKWEFAIRQPTVNVTYHAYYRHPRQWYAGRKRALRRNCRKWIIRELGV